MESLTDNLNRVDFELGPISIDMIEYNLYLGGLAAARNLDILNKYGITHILTIENFPLPKTIEENKQFSTMFIKLSDQPKEDLLSHFDATDVFIKDGLLKGAVLVHCVFGKSRSASVVIAHIMKKYGITYSEAFDRVKAKRHIICPNRGFISQLKLYKKMGYTVDQKSMNYKVHRLIVAADKVQRLRMLPQQFYDVIQLDPGRNQTLAETNVFRCLKCRRIIATRLNLIKHQDKGENCSKTYFLEPLAWMNCIQNSEGKLPCPKCNVKLGAFSWVEGHQCPCGFNLEPAFYLAPSKVDYSQSVGPARMVELHEKHVPFHRGKR